MILPNGNIKKFVKMTIGLILILVIINPFIKLVQGDINIEREVLKNIDKKYEYQLGEHNEFEKYKDSQIKDLYIKKIKEEIDSDIISNSNYKINDIRIDIDEKSNTDNYGHIEKISIILTLKETEEQAVTAEKDNIKDVKIDIKLEKLGEIKKYENLKDEKTLNNKPDDLKNIKIQIAKKFELDKQKIFIELKTND